MVFDPSQLCIIEFGDRTLTVRYRFFKLLIITNMNALRNKVSLIGRLGAQPEVTTFETGRTLARFTLAVNEGYKDKDGNTDLIFNTTDNHYLHGWFEDRGFNEYKNVINMEDIDKLIESINESVNCLKERLDEFLKYFPDKYVESYLMYYSRKLLIYFY